MKFFYGCDIRKHERDVFPCQVGWRNRTDNAWIIIIAKEARNRKQMHVHDISVALDGVQAQHEFSHEWCTMRDSMLHRGNGTFHPRLSPRSKNVIPPGGTLCVDFLYKVSNAAISQVFYQVQPYNGNSWPPLVGDPTAASSTLDIWECEMPKIISHFH